MPRTGFFHDERCLWHGGGNFAFLAPVGGLVQPLATGGLPEGPEAKRRILNLMQVTGLADDLEMRGADPADDADLARVHDPAYLAEFRRLSDAGGGEIGLRAPFGPGGFEIAALSAGLARAALFAVLDGDLDNAYALSRPPGHHCTADWPNGFCLLNNVAIAAEAAIAAGKARRIAILDWDVHHGNGTQAIFYDRADVLTISLHQDRNYPHDSGAADERGRGTGLGANMNVPLPPGSGHATWTAALARLAIPALHAFRPDAILVACGFDASGVDPLSRTLCGADTFRAMTRSVLGAASDLCGGRVAMVHEGGYSELHVPFCAHAVLEAMSGSAAAAPDPLAKRIAGQQPDAALEAHFAARLDDLERVFATPPRD